MVYAYEIFAIFLFVFSLWLVFSIRKTVSELKLSMLSWQKWWSEEPLYWFQSLPIWRMYFRIVSGRFAFFAVTSHTWQLQVENCGYFFFSNAQENLSNEKGFGCFGICKNGIIDGDLQRSTMWKVNKKKHFDWFALGLSNVLCFNESDVSFRLFTSLVRSPAAAAAAPTKTTEATFIRYVGIRKTWEHFVQQNSESK